MRIFKVLRGQYEGDYNIYDSEEEFRKEHPDKKIHIWGEMELEESLSLEAGDWVRALDGYIVQVLKVTLFTGSKKHPTSKNSHRFMVRAPMGTFHISYRKNGSCLWQKFYAQFAQQDPYSLTGTKESMRTSTMTKQKTMFAEYIKNGLPPIDALKKSGVYLGNSVAAAQAKVFYFMNSDEVREMIKKDSQMFIARMKDDPAFSDEAMMNYLKEFMIKVRKGSLQHLQSIPLILSLLDKKY